MQRSPESPLVEGAHTIGGSIKKLKEKAQDAAVSNAVSQLFNMIIRAIGV
jgi:hypothetical protein